MNITCSKSNLLNAVNIVLKAVSNKTTMQILECIVIHVTDKIKFISNDTDLGIETILEGTIIEEGIIALEAKVFSEIVRKLPDSDVNIKTDSNLSAFITCEKAKFNISGQSGETFPYLPELNKVNSIEISQFTLKEVIRQTVFSIGDSDSNKIMTGELFDIKDNTLTVISLDGHRISIRKIELNQSYDQIKSIVPGKALSEISKILSGENSDIVNISFSDKHIIFEFDSTIVVSRVIEGEYYKINQMFSNDYETKVSINKKEFLNCIERASLLVRESDKKPIVIQIKDDLMELKINSIIGSMNEDIDIVKDGKDILIAFNPKFLVDALRVIDDETIDIYLFNPKAPCLIKDSKESYIYLILPINFNVNN